MSWGDRSLYRVQTKSVLSNSWMSVNIWNLINADWTESNTVASCTDASIVLSNERWTRQEMAICTMTAWVATISYRWLAQWDTIVEVPANKLAWPAWTIIYVTKLAFNYANDYPKKTETNTWSAKQTFWDIDVTWTLTMKTASEIDVLWISNPQPNFVNETARDAVYTTPHNGDKCTVNGVECNYNGYTTQREYTWSSTPVPNASTWHSWVVKMWTALSDPDQVAWLYNITPNSVVKSYIDTLYNLLWSFGDWSDWDVTISWTVVLSRDMFYNNLIIPTWQILNPNWYRFYVAWTLTWAWKIQRNWNNWWDGSWQTHWNWATALNSWTLNADIAWSNWWDWGSGSWNAGGSDWTIWLSNNPSYSTINGVTWWHWWPRWGGWVWGNWWAGWTSTRWALYNLWRGPRIWFALMWPASYSLSTTQYKWISWSWGWWGWGCSFVGWATWWGGWGWWGNWWFIRAAIKTINRTWTRESIGWIWGNWWIAYGTWWGWGWGSGWVVFVLYHTLTSFWTETYTWWTWWTWWNAWTNWNTWLSIKIAV